MRLRSRAASVLGVTFVLAAALLPWETDAIAAGPGMSLTASGETVDIRAEKLDVDVGAGTAALDGKVQLKRGDLTVTCPHIDVKFERDGRVTWAKGKGAVVADFRGTHGEAEEAEVDLARMMVELRGNVRVLRGGSSLTASKAGINLATGRINMDTVHGVLAGPVPSASASAQ